MCSVDIMNKIQTKGITLSDSQAAWLAGLFEGEATFGFTTSGHPRVGLQMTDRDIVQRVAEIFNVKVSVRKKAKGREHHKDLHLITICKAQVLCDSLTRILPFMGKRRSKRIIEMLDYFKQKNISPTHI